MARPGRPERNRAARSFRQLRRFPHVINSDKVFGTHRGDSSYLYATATQQPYLRSRFLSCWRSVRSYYLRPIMVRGGGMRGKDEKTRIEPLGSPSSREMRRAAKRRRKNRGMPPPAT